MEGNNSIIEKNIFSKSFSAYSASFRLGWSGNSIKNEYYKNNFEFFPEASPYHGSLHSSYNLNYIYNNISYSKTEGTSWGDLFFTYINSEGLKYSNYFHSKSINFVCCWDGLIISKFININFNNITCNLLFHHSSTTTISLKNCYLFSINYQNICNNDILEFNECYFNYSTFSTFRCKLFINNHFNIKIYSINFCDLNCNLNNNISKSLKKKIKILFFNLFIFI